MAKVYPFRGLRYAPEIPVEKVVTQPYDKISKEMQERYYAIHPQNIIRIILGKAEAGDSSESNVYTRAARFLQEWRSSGVLQPLPAPTFVVYFQRFTIPGTSEARVRKGFIGLGRLEDYANKVIFPHERTLSGPKQDRLQLLRHTRTQFEQIFMLYEDPTQRIDKALDEVAGGKPEIEVTDEYGVVHTLWIVNSPSMVDRIQQDMADKNLIIADGHHRYETALAYRDEMRAAQKDAGPDASFERMPMTFFNMHSPGLTILPTHRVVANVKDFSSDDFLRRAGQFFDLSSAPIEAAPFRSALTQSGKEHLTIGVTTEGGKRNVLLRLKPSSENRPLDVIALHQLLIERCLGISQEAVTKESNISYVREFDAALKAVREGGAQIAFLLNPTQMDQMRDIAYAGQVMPQKSTDFYPKVLSGLMMYSLD